ncbi:MAG TPA: hypothetical protein VM327_04170 [Candidatus Thermoplasmatota archaeon]|nr:hypothetical protein [Candidatus Thermoplasmatota archaeon]
MATAERTSLAAAALGTAGVLAPFAVYGFVSWTTGDGLRALVAALFLGLPLTLAFLVAATVWSAKAIRQRRRESEGSDLWRRRRTWAFSLVAGGGFLGFLYLRSGAVVPFGLVALAMLIVSAWMFYRLRGSPTTPSS